MTFKYNYQKSNKTKFIEFEQLLLMALIFGSLLFLFLVNNNLMSQPVELEFSGKVFGNFEIDNVRVNYVEGHWKIKAPLYMFNKFIENNGRSNYCVLNGR